MRKHHTDQIKLIQESQPEYEPSADEDAENEMAHHASTSEEAWAIDQLAKSEYFHQKLHQWGVREVAGQIEETRGEDLDWDLRRLQISDKAWARVIHHGIKPISVFAHSQILTRVPRAVSYYRMLAMVSQKSMTRVGLSATGYEEGSCLPTTEAAEAIAQRLNAIISNLIEADETVEPREFDLWRGMAAGSQAQGSWSTIKGHRIEVVVKGLLQRRIRESGLISAQSDNGQQINLVDGRRVILADEPDFAIYRDRKIEAALEIKGGIDPAGVLERIGAAIKSLGRAKRENPESKTILVIQGVSMTPKAYEDLQGNREAVNHWFLVEEVLDEVEIRARLFALLDL